jgi:hypothetical protein
LEQKDRRFEKGFFTASRFAVAAKYLALTSRRRLFAAGALAGLGFVIFFLADAFIGNAATVTGKLSENHALFAKDCSSCHTPGKGVTNANCLSCHRKSGMDPATFTFARHYEYHSGETDRSAPENKEGTCASCHSEHKGRLQPLQQVADGNCATCHTQGSFASAGGHPEFQFVRDTLEESANLKFTHVIHVRRVMERDSLPEAEAACLSCHVPASDGRSFQPISYAKSCDGCHLDGESTPFVPLRGGGQPGVVTLDEIRRSGTPGTQWADHWNANEVAVQGSIARKRPVYHADPWILENLRRLRQELYPGAALADLLRTSPELTSARDARLLHREAIETLRSQIESIRGDPSPDVQREVATLNRLVDTLEARVDQPFAPLDETKFAVTDASRDTTKDEAAYRRVVDGITKPCQMCHLVERATIRRPQTDQRSLVRAQFNHAAHITHRGCLDCHTVIPIRDSLAGNDDLPREIDNAEILNLPSVATCQSCHTKSAASTRCVSCHLFHPDKSHLSRLTR